MPRPELIFHPKFEPLFLKDRKGGPRYTILTSGRAGGKSTAVSTASVCDTYLDPYTVLYSRQTMTSARVSVIPEYNDKIRILGKQRHFAVKEDMIVNRRSGGKLIFRGIQTSSGNQTAKLKSIPNLRKFFLDEAQELVNPVDFDTIDLSIRLKDAPNEIWLALNPSDIHHWIYKRFFRKPGVPYDYNGVVDDVRYIHTDWRDVREYLSQSFIDNALKMEREQPDKYANLYLGDWSVRRSGLIYPRWRPVTLADIPLGLDWWYGNDWGYSNDPDALVRMAFDPLTRTLYIVEVMYSTGKLPKDVAAAIRQDCEARGTTADRALVYCDPARPDSIQELRLQYGINAVPGINRDKVGRIGYLQGFKVCYVGENVREEAETYSWEPDKADPEVFTNVPQDGGDHCFVGSTIIATTTGEKRIDEITENDLVLTSEGYRRVLKIFDNGYKEIRKYSINFANFAVEIEATPDHKIKTAEGWKQLKELCATDVLFLSRSSMERSTTSIPESAISADTTSDCTGSCGNTTTDRSRRGATSTTRTETQPTTKSKTSNSLSASRTCQSTPARTSRQTPNASSEICTRRWRQQRSGTSPKPDGNGIGSTPGCKASDSTRKSNTPATSAGKPSSITGGPTNTTSAHGNAARPGEGPAASMMSPGPANGAGRSSAATGTSLSDSVATLVPLPIVSISASSPRIERVFDLHVEDMHEYLANGVLVHNCMDAISYGSTHLRRMGIPNDDGDLPGIPQRGVGNMSAADSIRDWMNPERAKI